MWPTPDRCYIQKLWDNELCYKEIQVYWLPTYFITLTCYVPQKAKSLDLDTTGERRREKVVNILGEMFGDFNQSFHREVTIDRENAQ